MQGLLTKASPWFRRGQTAASAAPLLASFAFHGAHLPRFPFFLLAVEWMLKVELTLLPFANSTPCACSLVPRPLLSVPWSLALWAEDSGFLAFSLHLRK